MFEADDAALRMRAARTQSSQPKKIQAATLRVNPQQTVNPIQNQAAAFFGRVRNENHTFHASDARLANSSWCCGATYLKLMNCAGTHNFQLAVIDGHQSTRSASRAPLTPAPSASDSSPMIDAMKTGAHANWSSAMRCRAPTLPAAGTHRLTKPNQTCRSGATHAKPSAVKMARRRLSSDGLRSTTSWQKTLPMAEMAALVMALVSSCPFFCFVVF